MLSPSQRRRLSYIASAIGVARKGFYTPYQFLNNIDYDVEEYSDVRLLFEAARPAFFHFIDRMAQLEDRMLATREGPDALNWSARLFPPLDVAALYTAIDMFRPKRILEIGSGNSTRVIVRACRDAGIECAITCIDPQPRLSIDNLPVTFERSVLRSGHIALIESMDPNDIVFVDNSHIALQGSDVDIIFSRFFPRLPHGVVVHVHDVFLPYPYPMEWREFRWNEQIVLIPWLFAGCFDLVFGSQYACRDLADAVSRLSPRLGLMSPPKGGGLWLQRRSG